MAVVQRGCGELVDAVRAGLAAVADPAVAPEMQRYMKSAMPFRGVPKPARERLLRAVLLDHAVAEAGQLRMAVRELWTNASYREERYLALAIVGHRRFAGWQDPSWVPLYREWIVSGAWWDVTDEIANRRIGPLLRAYPDGVTPVMLEWTVDGDPWLRRTSILCQLGSGERTDLALLTAAIEASVDDQDFFLRKAIGWALRQHARCDPDWVRAFVVEHPQLSPLSRREALRHVT